MANIGQPSLIEELLDGLWEEDDRAFSYLCRLSKFDIY
jgi:hypothetical protein